jgi:hypothetical protein
MGTRFADDRQRSRACRLIGRLGGWTGDYELFTLAGPTPRALGYHEHGLRDDGDSYALLAWRFAMHLWFGHGDAPLDEFFDSLVEESLLEGLGSFLIAHRRGPAAIERWLREHGDADRQDVAPEEHEDPGPDFQNDRVVVIEARSRRGRRLEARWPVDQRLTRDEFLEKAAKLIREELGTWIGNLTTQRMVLQIGAPLTKARAHAVLHVRRSETVDDVVARVASLI